jgi:hypothetical protein
MLTDGAVTVDRGVGAASILIDRYLPFGDEI